MAIAARPTGLFQPNTGPGLFTMGQAVRAEQVFNQFCLSCHRVADQTGASFRAKWANGGLGALFNLIYRTMPENAGGGLAMTDYAAIIAYMLRESGYPAGSSDLPADADLLAKAQMLIR